ncbi:hypothetical protein TWF481_010805 [Arthrobotrys musiformis]|uniref:SGNH hydrolase-type esterase domain-containing protein n=1 Tax=Arthrobotrys musiformis TaxID=47236 RepID=A0AAV9W1X8_9PEZI
MHLSVFFGLVGAALAQSVAEATESPVVGEQSTFVTSRIPTAIPLGATFTRSMPSMPTPSGPPVRYWFSFGDSYTSTNFSVNGVQPSVEKPFGNPLDIWHKEKYNATWIQYITSRFNESITLNYNLARIGASLTYTNENTTSRRSFKGQVNLFTSKYASLPAEKKIWQQNVDTMYSSWFGVNDVKGIFGSGGNSTDPRIDELITSQFSLLDQLYFDVDAKVFLVINLPPLETAPLFAADKTRMEGIVRSWNNNLARQVRQFRDSHPVSSILLIDSYNIIKKLEETPSYGVRNGVWADKLHIKTQVHKVLAKEIAAVLDQSVLEAPTNGTIGGPTTFVDQPTPTMGHGGSATSGTLW